MTAAGNPNDSWDERDRQYEALRSRGYGPDHAQDVVDGLREPHEDPSKCVICADWMVNDEPSKPPRAPQ